VFENRVTRKVFGPEGEEVAGYWRKLRKDEINNSYSSQNIISVTNSRRMRWAGYAACMAKKRNLYSDLVGKPEGKRRLGRP
jgi:hypothetical protein